MSAILLTSHALTMVSGTNLDSATPITHLGDDRLGLDCVFTSNTTIKLALDSSVEWDTIAIINSTVNNSSQVTISHTSNADYTTGAVSTGALPSGAGTYAERNACQIFEVASTTNRYITITTTSTSGSYSFGRIVVGKRVITNGVRTNAERTFNDNSVIYESGAYVGVVDSPTQMGWKVEFPWANDSFFRNTWQPFFAKVGKKKPFLFLPTYSDASTWGADWSYGRIIDKAQANHVGSNAWIVKMEQRSIYP